MKREHEEEEQTRASQGPIWKFLLSDIFLGVALSLFLFALLLVEARPLWDMALRKKISGSGGEYERAEREHERIPDYLQDNFYRGSVVAFILALFFAPFVGHAIFGGWGIFEWIVVASPVIIALCLVRADRLLPVMIEKMGTKASAVLIVAAALILGWLLFHPSN